PAHDLDGHPAGAHGRVAVVDQPACLVDVGAGDAEATLRLVRLGAERAWDDERASVPHREVSPLEPRELLLAVVERPRAAPEQDEGVPLELHLRAFYSWRPARRARGALRAPGSAADRTR